MAGVTSRVGPKVLLGPKNWSNLVRLLSGGGGWHEAKVGNREIVGYGFNGVPCYVDRLDYPFPSIRWKEISPEYCALHEKERGDWRTLTLDEKKCLYRYSYRQTFAEIKAPSGEWKSIVGLACMLVSLGLWLALFNMAYIYDERPKSFTEKYQRAQLRRMIDLQMNPVTGESSRWDYEKDDWKKTK